jgi:hypothetical protein
MTHQYKDEVHTECLTSDTTAQKTVEPEELFDVPHNMSEHIHKTFRKMFTL